MRLPIAFWYESFSVSNCKSFNHCNCGQLSLDSIDRLQFVLTAAEELSVLVGAIRKMNLKFGLSNIPASTLVIIFNTGLVSH